LSLAAVARLLVVVILTGPSLSLRAQGPAFVEISDAAGVGVVGFSYGHSWGDYDRDGLIDLFVSFVGRPHLLYRNTGGAFQSVNAAAGILDDADPAGEGSVFADYDNDGDLDLFVSNGCKPSPQSPSTLYRNNGNGTFTLRTQEAGLQFTGKTQGTAWADYDIDGDIDLYLGLLVTPGRGNFLHRNNNDGTFTDVAAAAGVADERDSNGGVAWADYNNDGYPDLFVGNRNQLNRLYRNNGNGTFTDQATTAGIQGGDNSEGGAWGDYDNDGWLDLFVASLDLGGHLYRNNRDGTFTNATVSAGVNLPGSGVGVNWVDYDNNGWLDLLVVNAGGTFPIRLYRNNRDGTFTDIASAAGLTEHVDDGRVGGWGDINNDGFLDLFISNYGKNRMFRNTPNGNHWLVLKPQGVTGNRDGIGARVEVTAVINGQTVRQIREVSAGGNRHAQDSMPLEFGLGDATAAEVLISFPGGSLQQWGRVAADQTVVFRQGAKAAFSDHTLTAASSVVRAVHMNELRTRIDSLRARYGLSAYSYSDPSLVPESTTIRSQHVSELRAALREAYLAAGLAPLVYTDPTIGNGTAIKAAHVTELRAGVLAIE